jgi:hypothetical protein
MRRVSWPVALAILTGSVALLCVAGVAFFVAISPGRTAARPAVIRTTDLDTVNVWRDYSDRSRGVVGTVRNGQQVELIRTSGGGALIRAGAIEGWVSEALVE